MTTVTHRVLRSTFAILIGLVAWTGRANAADLPDAPALPEAADNSVPGLTLTFQSKDATDARAARIVSLYVPTGAPPTPFLAPGPFTATFDGSLEQRLRGDYKFSFKGNGKVKLSIAGKVVLEADGDLGAADPQQATLKKGKNKFTLEYTAPATGDAWLRMYWSSDDFAPEPVDPKYFSHSTTGKPIATGLRLREGRALVAELRCLKCHADGSTAAKDGMPELAKDAPNLEGVGARLNEQWMARWISNPKALRPDTAMPNVFHGKPGATVQEAADIAAYLAAQTTGQPAAPADAGNEKDLAVAGGKLVAQLGCIGCHTLPAKEIGADPNRVTWHNVKAKYKPGALVDFLKQPEKHFAWIRMPNFRLNDDEAKKLAAYLTATSADVAGDAPPKGDAAKGEKLFASSGCVNCHGLAKQNDLKVASLADIPRDAWAKGCMAKDDAARGKAPDFALTDDARTALLAFAATDRSSLTRESFAEAAERQVTESRCVACHSRDNKLDAWDELAKELAPLKAEALDPESAGAGGAGNKANPGEPQPGTGDQTRPPLTWVGEKLQPTFTETFIGGKLDYKPRMWMVARMPGFPARAAIFAKGLSLEHGYLPVDEQAASVDPAAADLGKKLVGRVGGFACIQCHGIAAIGPISPFEAPSINFKYAKERLRHDYYVRWMRNPVRIVPTTKMPAFAQEGGKTQLVDVLDGDADKQFDAIWQYLMAGRKIEHPEQ